MENGETGETGELINKCVFHKMLIVRHLHKLTSERQARESPGTGNDKIKVLDSDLERGKCIGTVGLQKYPR
jgi:hypothetical protein